MKKFIITLIMLLLLGWMLLPFCNAAPTPSPSEPDSVNKTVSADNSSVTANQSTMTNPSATASPNTMTNPSATASPNTMTNPSATASPNTMTNPSATANPNTTNNPSATANPNTTNNPSAEANQSTAANPSAKESQNTKVITISIPKTDLRDGETNVIQIVKKDGTWQYDNSNFTIINIGWIALVVVALISLGVNCIIIFKK